MPVPTILQEWIQRWEVWRDQKGNDGCIQVGHSCGRTKITLLSHEPNGELFSFLPLPPPPPQYLRLCIYFVKQQFRIIPSFSCFQPEEWKELSKVIKVRRPQVEYLAKILQDLARSWKILSRSCLMRILPKSWKILDKSCETLLRSCQDFPRFGFMKILCFLQDLTASYNPRLPCFLQKLLLP